MERRHGPGTIPAELMPKQRGVWPPADPIVRVLEELIDSSPHGEWLTSSESQGRAERIIAELAKRGYIITRQPRSPRSEGFRPMRDGIDYDSSEQ